MGSIDKEAALFHAQLWLTGQPETSWVFIWNVFHQKKAQGILSFYFFPLTLYLWDKSEHLHNCWLEITVLNGDSGLVARLCQTRCNCIHYSPPGSSMHEISQAKTRVGSHSLLQGIFPTQGSKLHLVWQVGSFPLSHL